MKEELERQDLKVLGVDTFLYIHLSLNPAVKALSGQDVKLFTR